jgi:hypothetical protein
MMRYKGRESSLRSAKDPARDLMRVREFCALHEDQGATSGYTTRVNQTVNFVSSIIKEKERSVHLSTPYNVRCRYN